MADVKKNASGKKDAGKHGIRRLFATGFAMGSVDVVPGVSGGTVAFLFGIYEELLYSIKTVTGTTLKLLLRGKINAAWKSIPFHFLVPLFAGLGIAVFSLAKLLSYLLETQEVFVWAFFFGLVVASALVIRKRISHWTAGRIAALIAGAAMIFWLVGLTSGSLGSGPLALFLTGAVAFCAWILPGISGSLIMVIMGQYETVLNAVSEFNIASVAIVVAGGAVGLALFSRLLTWLFQHYYGIVIAFLIGMLLGSLRSVWPWRSGEENILPPLDWTLLIGIILAIAGFMLVLQLEKFGVTKEHDEDITDKEFKKEHQKTLKNNQ